mmetsp:Transcript_65950/g.118882  ORF Transcript_65950/g.118882 Transcript_65950/m.118882 type:complete len:293 (-) Transcript_65950:639-1517(-)
MSSSSDMLMSSRFSIAGASERLEIVCFGATLIAPRFSAGIGPAGLADPPPLAVDGVPSPPPVVSGAGDWRPERGRGEEWGPSEPRAVFGAAAAAAATAWAAVPPGVEAARAVCGDRCPGASSSGPPLRRFRLLLPPPPSLCSSTSMASDESELPLLCGELIAGALGGLRNCLLVLPPPAMSEPKARRGTKGLPAGRDPGTAWLAILAIPKAAGAEVGGGLPKESVGTMGVEGMGLSTAPSVIACRGGAGSVAERSGKFACPQLLIGRRVEYTPLKIILDRHDHCGGPAVFPA